MMNSILTPHRLQRTSGNESWQFCRLELAASGLYQQVSIVYLRYSNGETETIIYEIYTDIRNTNKADLAYHFEFMLITYLFYENICVLECSGKIT